MADRSQSDFKPVTDPKRDLKIEKARSLSDTGLEKALLRLRAGWLLETAMLPAGSA